MNKGKITIESGEYKAILNIEELEPGELFITYNYEPMYLSSTNFSTNFVNKSVFKILEALKKEPKCQNGLWNWANRWQKKIKQKP